MKFIIFVVALFATVEAFRFKRQVDLDTSKNLGVTSTSDGSGMTEGSGSVLYDPKNTTTDGSGDMDSTVLHDSVNDNEGSGIYMDDVMNVTANSVTTSPTNVEAPLSNTNVGNGNGTISEVDLGTSTTEPVLTQTVHIVVPDDGTDRLLIQVQLPQRNSTMLMQDLEDVAATETTENKLDMAISITQMLQSLMTSIDDAVSSDANTTTTSA